MAVETKLSLYYYDSCSYCRRVLHELAFLAVSFEKRNILQDDKHYQDLQKCGGNTMVPCLLIEEDGRQEWMYESRDIIQYLREHYSGSD